jgi:dipeptidyl aminopeptidase/acylaminoacyl peptidase
MADPKRMVVRGGSAGGLTALAAARVGGPFAVALVSYGVTDLSALATDTHDFESRYLDSLVGPWPEAAALYRERSPVHHPDRIGASVLLLQGADDPVVPPTQSESLVEALIGRGVQVQYKVFEGEGHGFRLASTLVEGARTELEFVRQVLGSE